MMRIAMGVCVAGWIGWYAAAGAQESPAAPPNVLFLICDDLNCDLGCYGHPLVKTPNIDRLASRGVRFNRAYCQYPLCGPSRASFMTGFYPDQTLVRRNAIYIREHVPNVTTLPQAFRGHDYFAMRIGKIYHYNVPKHIGTGGHDDPYSWNYTINPRGRDKEDEGLVFSLRPGSYGGTLSWLAAAGQDTEQTDGIAATEAVDILERFSQRATPFFLAVGLYRPHTPYVAPTKYFEKYALDEITVPSIPENYYATLPKPAVQSITRRKEQLNLDPNLARQAIQAYYASISFADAQLGRILDALEATGLADNTIVLFTSDHGYHMGEHGHWQKTTLFENACRVPLIIAGPGVSETGKASDAPVEMVDFYPTLTELAGIAPPPSLSGVSLVPVLHDVAARPRGSALTQYATGYSLRTDRYRYTLWGPEGVDGAELYDHADDPQELRNLAGRSDWADVESQLRTELLERIAEANRPPEGVKQIRAEINRNVPQPYN
ncbi:MAG: DUF229 domain-containing protein [Planctomycetota bacterium]|nr:MAG: DUF229 domain-containing protein [Planctomycetota bacterium]